MKQKAHTLNISVGHRETNDTSEDKPKPSNPLFRALNKRKAQKILEMNAATQLQEVEEEVIAIEMTGLTEEQLKILQESRCLFRYCDSWRLYWDIFIMLLAIWNWFVIPVEVAFEPDAFKNPTFIVVNSLIDLCFAVDIFVVFRTTYIDRYTGGEVLDGKKIAINYLLGRFWIDLLATIPFDTIALIFGGNNSAFQLFGILKLIRITRLSRIISYMNVVEDVKLMLKLVKLVFFLIMYLHLLGWAWFYLINENKEWVPPLDYVYVTTTFFEQSINRKYWMSIYHAVLIQTGNDIGPRDDTTHVMFCAVFITFGAIVNAYIFGELVVLVSIMNAKTAKFVQKLDIWNTAMKNQNLPKEIQHEVISYLTFTHALLDSQQELETFLDLISPSLKEKVIMFIFSEELKNTDLFAKSDNLIINISKRLKTKIYQPEEDIVIQGEDGNKMYFIAKGGWNVFTKNKFNRQQKVNTLKPGDYFGEIALLNSWKRTATVRANNYSTIGFIEKDAFEIIFDNEPETMEKLKNGRKNYQDQWKVFQKDLLKYIDYIKHCSEDTVEELTYYLKEQNYEIGDTIFSAGQIVDRINFITNGEVDIIVKIGKKEAILDTLYQACNIGEYGVLGDYRHTFTARAKTKNVHIIYITKDSLTHCRNRFSDLYKEADKWIDFLENSGLPLVDFRIYRNSSRMKNTIEVLKLAVARIMRINDALEANYDPEEITELLREVQIKMIVEEEDDKDSQKNTNKLLQTVLQRIKSLQQENQELKFTLVKFEKKMAKVDKSVSAIKAEVTGNPNTHLSNSSGDEGAHSDASY
jgi:CRP-like cAMP-binding protein